MEEAGRDLKFQECLVLKINPQAVIFAGGEELYFLDDLAFDARKPDKAPVRELLLLKGKLARAEFFGGASGLGFGS